MAVSGLGTLLVLRALGLGDLLTSIPALRGLRRAFPAARLVLAGPDSLAELLPLIGAVDALWPTSGPRSFAWTGAPPGLAVNLHGRGPESIVALRSSGAARIMTHAHPSFPWLDGPQWIEEQHERRRWCRLVEHFGFSPDPEDFRIRSPARSGGHPGAAVIHPGASHRARQWPEQRFARVASELVRRGHHVVITGSSGERSSAERIAATADLPVERVLAGRTRLIELAAVVAEARLVVCGDTGMAHLATAFATPSVVLFGPVSPQRWGPPDLPRHAALWAGELGDTFAERPDRGLLRLSPSAVLDAVDTVLGSAEIHTSAGNS